MSNLLEAKGIHKTYKDGKRSLEVLKGINLTIKKGEFTAIAGPSGAGKSTLLHILGGLDKPTKGEVVIGDDNIYRLSDASISRLRNQRIGFVFQFYHLLSEFTVLENTLMPALISNRSAAESLKFKEAAIDLLDKVGLKQRAQHFPAQLSGGEAQRAAIARGLINNPEVLLCDEPTGNLDSKTGDEIISLIKKINFENKMTVVIVTHNIELAKSADRLYRLEDGVLN